MQSMHGFQIGVDKLEKRFLFSIYGIFRVPYAKHIIIYYLSTVNSASGKNRNAAYTGFGTTHSNKILTGAG